MLFLDAKDYIIITLKTLVFTILLVLFLSISIFNVDFANYVCDITEIPRDLALTMTSLGFRNNMIVVLSVFEFGIFYFLYGKIKKTKLYNKFFEFLIN